MFEDLLGYVSDTLGKPGRAVKGLLGGRPEEALAAIPFSDSLGITDKSNAVSGEDLFKKHFGPTGSETADSILGFGTDLLTDPLTYAGGFLGRMGGKALGRSLEGAAAARGPGFATTGAELMQSAAKGGGGATFALEDLMAHPSWSKAVSEIPTGSQYLGHGAEALAFKTPTGDVARVSRPMFGAETRPIDPGILPAHRTVDYGVPGAEAIRVERSPLAQPLAEFGANKPILNAEQNLMANRLPEELAGRGLDYFDSHIGNVGMHGGRPVVIDPGSVLGLPGARDRPLASAIVPGGDMRVEAAAKQYYASGGAPVQWSPLTTPAAPDRVQKYLLDLLGGQSAMQRALAAGRSAPRYQQGLGAAGTVAGASLGAF